VPFQLTVYRAKAFMLRGRPFHLEIDGLDIGKLRPGSPVTTTLDEGEHHVRVYVGNERSKVVTIHAAANGSASLVAQPADLDPDARTQRLARRDPFVLELAEGEDASRVGPTFGQLYRSLPPSFGNPARTRPQQALWLLGLALAAGFVLLPLARNGIGILFLFAGALIAGWQWISYLRWSRRT
jgi:hypothetical protein